MTMTMTAAGGEASHKLHEGNTGVPSVEAYVVLHTGLGRFVRGDVLTEGDLPRSEISRHLGLGSIRLAYPAEAQQKRVQLPDEVKEVSFNQKLAEKDEQIMSLQAQIREMQDQYQRQANPATNATLAAERTAHAALLKEKDRAFSDLNEQYKAVKLRHDALDRQCRELEQDKLDLQHRIALMESSQATPSVEDVARRVATLSQQQAPPPSAAEEAQQQLQQALSGSAEQPKKPGRAGVAGGHRG